MSTRWYPNDKVQGDGWDFVFYRTSSGAPLAMVGYSHQVAIKIHEAADDPLLTFTCVEDPDTGLGRFTASVTSTQTETIAPGRYYITVQETVPAGEPVTLLHGWLKVRAQAA